MVSPHSRQTLLGLLHLYSTITSQLQAVHDQIKWFQLKTPNFIHSQLYDTESSVCNAEGWLFCIRVY